MLKVAGPSTPVQLLGLKGCPETNDTLVGFDSETEARKAAGDDGVMLMMPVIACDCGVHGWFDSSWWRGGECWG